MSAIIYLVLAGVVGTVVGCIPGKRPPYAPAACALAALIVSVMLSLSLGDAGPHLLEVAVLPATAGALIGASILRFALGHVAERTR